jgi:hypothetical protein
MLKLDGAIIRRDQFDWLIETASDLETADRAIVIADVTGSVGATEERGENHQTVF